MKSDRGGFNRRILVIDDNRSIHDDFRKILGSGAAQSASLHESEAALFGDADELVAAPPAAAAEFHIESAFQGEDGIALVRRACEADRPYAMAFIDARMPPGLDGIETAAKIWEHDSAIQIVICTAYSDYSWQDIRRKLKHAHRLVILKKPFDNIEVLQLADALTEKWRLARDEERRVEILERRLTERNRDQEAIHGITAQIDSAGDQKASAAAAQGAGDMSDAATQRRRMLTHDLPQALAANELSLHYQPLVDIASRRIVSLEALLRWTHPRLGAISPGEFIPLAEQTGLIVSLGDFVLKSACAQIVRWEREKVPVVPVAVNLSVVQLEQQDVWAAVRGILRETGLLPHRLALEITESALMKNMQRHAKTLQGLRGDGVQIQIDDFGTGYSSLSCLKHLPIDTLKIDRTFIRQIDTSSTDEAIVSAVLAMARSLGLRVVAEGVETPGQLEVLGRHGCEIAQGFYFSRPLPADGCRELLFQLTQSASFTDTLRLRVITDPRLRAGNAR